MSEVLAHNHFNFFFQYSANVSSDVYIFIAVVEDMGIELQIDTYQIVVVGVCYPITLVKDYEHNF